MEIDSCFEKNRIADGINVTDFTTSWSSGLALCALIHYHCPATIDWASLEDALPYERTTVATMTAEGIGLTMLMDPEDWLVMPKPDKHAIIVTLSELYLHFKDPVCVSVDLVVSVESLVDKIFFKSRTAALESNSQAVRRCRRRHWTPKSTETPLILKSSVWRLQRNACLIRSTSCEPAPVETSSVRARRRLSVKRSLRVSSSKSERPQNRPRHGPSVLKTCANAKSNCELKQVSN